MNTVSENPIVPFKPLLEVLTEDVSASRLSLWSSCRLRFWGHQGQRIDAYKNYRLRDKAAHDLVIRATDVGACTNRMIPQVLKEWREPPHPEFEDRSAWSLFNAFTEILKGNLPELPKRTEVLHGLFDAQVGLTLAHLN